MKALCVGPRDVSGHSFWRCDLLPSATDHRIGWPLIVVLHFHHNDGWPLGTERECNACSCGAEI